MIRRLRAHPSATEPMSNAAPSDGREDWLDWPSQSGTFGDVHRRSGAGRNAWRDRADRKAYADQDVLRRRGHARRRRGRCQLSSPWDRTYPVRLRSPAVRSGAGYPGWQLAARRTDRHRIHPRAQHHVGGGDARVCQCAGPARRGGYRTQHRAGRCRNRL